MNELSTRKATATSVAKAPAKKAAAKKAPAKKAPAKKAAAKKAPAKKAPAKKAAAKKSGAKKAAPKSSAKTASTAGTAKSSSVPKRPALAAPPTDPMTVLGLRPDFTLADLRRAWRDHAAVHHPDVGGDAATFTRGRNAYEALRDGLRR